MSQVSLGQYYTPPEIASWMVDLLGDPGPKTALEAGCGEGVFVEALLRRGYKNITAYDIDPTNCQTVRKKFGEDVTVRQQNFLKVPRSPSWDTIVGNPPYVRWKNIPAESQRILQSDPFWKNIASREWDLFYAFIIASTQVLRDGGQMCLIVPSGWMTATHAAPVRDYLQQGTMRDVLLLGEHRIFQDASFDAMIFVWEKSPPRKQVRVLHLLPSRKSLQDTVTDGRKIYKDHGESTQGDWEAHLSPQPKTHWRFPNRKDNLFLEKLETLADQKIGDVAEVAVGFVSGRDAAFLVEDAWTQTLSRSEMRFIRPFAKARSCYPGRLIRTASFIFVDEISSEKDLQKLPAIYAHLLPHKQSLLQRYGKQEWWQWATVRNEETFQQNLRKPKIFVPCIDRSPRPRFCITSHPVWGSGDTLLLAATGTDPWYLQAWLLSSSWNRWHQLSGPQGSRRRYTQSLLAATPFLPESRCSQKEIQEARDISKRLARIQNPQRREVLLQENDRLFDKIISKKRV